MPEFADFQQNAKQLSKKLMHCYMEQRGCFSFFSAIIPQLTDHSAIDDAHTIGLLADGLETEYDDDLLVFINNHTLLTVLNTRELAEYKNKVLIGMYLLTWSQYTSSVVTFLNKQLVELFQRDLQIQSPGEMDEFFFDSCLNALSQYCSFIYQNRNQQQFELLNQRLGISIQVTIHTVRNAKLNNNSIWSGLYTGIMGSLGSTNMS